MIVDLLRHGEPEGGVRYRGNGCDDPLSERGWTQMRAAIAAVPGEDRRWDAVVCSPLRRCREFAEEFAAQAGRPLQVLPDLREIGFGAWEGLLPDEVRTRRAAEYAAFLADPVSGRPPGAEPIRVFRMRVEAAIDAAVAEFLGGRLLVVAHAGVVRAAVGRVLEVPDEAFFRIECGYASLSGITRDDARGWRVHCVNRLP